MWTLYVLILNILPPTGITVKGFPDEKACLNEIKRFCDKPYYRCKCELTSVTYSTE
jgi:hypothetical protein